MKTFACNKGVNRPMEFRGLQAQYIWWVAGVAIGCLLLFAVLHLFGLSSWICLPVVMAIGGSGIAGVYRMSRVFGRFGLMKKRAVRRIPRVIRSRSGMTFQLSKQLLSRQLLSRQQHGKTAW
jgi:hypothetical protein